MNLEALDISLLGPALLAGLLVLATHVPLGAQVLARGIVFIDLAVAQIAGLGVIGAELLGRESGGLAGQAAAFIAALSGALLLAWTERRWPQTQEALIGTLFVLAASGGLLLLAYHPHGGEYLRDLLSGQILWVTWPQLVQAALLTAIVLGLWFGVGAQKLGRAGFYVLFACAVTASVQLVGVYLVFASLIVPALAVRSINPRKQLIVGYLVGVTGYAVGLAGSALLDLPSGAVIVWTLTLTALLAAWGIRQTWKNAGAENDNL